MRKEIFHNWPLITIYVVSKNHSKFIMQSLKSIVKQTYTNWELFFIDDNSKDKSFQIAKKINNKKIKFIKLRKNFGLQKIANYVLKKSKGKYLIRLDGDDWFDENALLNLVTKIEKNKNASAIYGGFYYTDENGEVIGEEKNLNINNKYFPPHGACTLFNTRSLKEVGGYSEKIKAQDGWEMWMKLKERSKIISTNTSVFYYRQHNNSLTNKKKILIQRDKIINKISKKLKGDYNPTITAILPIKNNFQYSKNIFMKNYKGKKLIDWAIQSILKSKLINNVVVTSKDLLIEKYLKKNYMRNIDKKILFLKRPNVFDNSIKLKELLKFINQNLINRKKIKSDIFIYLNLHIFNKDKNYIDKLINVLLLDKYDTVFSVTKERNPLFKIQNHKMEILNEGRFSNLEYRNEVIYKFNGAAIATWADTLEKKNIFKNNIGYLENEENKIIKILK